MVSTFSKGSDPNAESRQCVLSLQSKSPQAVQAHLGKCFDGIRRLEFGGDDPKSPDILAMVSAEGEKVPLGRNLKVSIAGCPDLSLH